MKKVIIITDGSALGNGQSEVTRAAAAAILSCQNAMRAVGSYLGSATNQQAEIIAACLALEALRAPAQVALYSDSRYVVETMKGSFARKSNHEIWERLDRAAQPHTITWHWIKGHSKRQKETTLDASIPTEIYRRQEACDKLAHAIASLGQVNDLLLTETVNKLQGQLSPATVRAVMDGLRYLSNACDGARANDAVGFNRYDAETGHRLASRQSLTPREVDLSRTILRKYHRQLASYDPAIVALI